MPFPVLTILTEPRPSLVTPEDDYPLQPLDGFSWTPLMGWHLCAPALQCWIPEPAAPGFCQALPWAKRALGRADTVLLWEISVDGD